MAAEGQEQFVGEVEMPVGNFLLVGILIGMVIGGLCGAVGTYFWIAMNAAQ